MPETCEASSTEPLPKRIRIPVDKPSKIITGNKNLVRMYDWQMELLDENGEVYQSAAVPAVPLPNQLAHGKFRIAPKLNIFFGWTPEMVLPQLDVRYSYQFINEFSGNIQLVMEPGSIVGDWSIQINNSELINSQSFEPTEAHIRGSLGADITPYVKTGNNTVTVNLKTNRIDGGLLNPLYLAGDFGVELEPLKVVEPKFEGGFDTWEENALPYYSGMVEYETSFELDKIPDEENVIIEINHGIPFQDATEVCINNGEWRQIPWSPYCTLTPSSELGSGINSLKIRVYTTLIRSFEGQWFDIENHCYREI